MSPVIRSFLAAGLMVCLPLANAAGQDNDGKSATKTRPTTRAKVKDSSAQQKTEHLVPEINLLDAARRVSSASGPKAAVTAG